MGRLGSARAQVMATIGFLLLAPGAVVVTDRLDMESGAPGLALLLALVVALLLSVGPRAAPAVAAGLLLEVVVVGGHPVSVAAVVLAVGQAAVAVAGVLVLERRFARHGPVRRPVVIIEFAVIAAAALPLATQLLPELLAGVGAIEPRPGPYLQWVFADGIGVLAIAAGARMALMRQRVGLDRSSLAGVAVATLLTVVSILATVSLSGVEGLASAQLVVLPIMVVALLLGTAGYAIAVALTTIAVVVPLSLWVGGATWGLSTGTHAAWWLVAALGLLLATDGDRRRAAAAEFRTFFMRSPAPMLSVNAGTARVTRANDAAGELFGTRAEDLVGRPVVEVVVGERVGERFRALLAGDIGEFSEEFAPSHGPGGVRWVRCVALRVDLASPQADIVQVQLFDLTAERERAAALERSNDALERFGRRVTHDLKQPLAAVATYASTLAEHAQRMDPSVVRTMYERLEAVAQRAVTQLDDTFSAAAVAAGGPVPVDLDEVVASTVGMIDIDLTESDGTVETALAVPRVVADPSMVRQVLLNLLTNSIKYARSDREPRVRVASRVRGVGVEVTVTDNGTGIPADLLDDVFERGRRLEPARADGRGHGLADSRDLAEAAGGWLRAEPWPDGARFVLWLPDPTVARVAATTRVLLVDDEPDALTVLAHRLQLEPAVEVVGTAATLQEAIAATRELRPDVVLLDRWLRDEDGLAGVLELARAHPDVRIILLTAHVTSDLHERARHGGVLRTLDKAVSDEDLVAELVGAAS